MGAGKESPEQSGGDGGGKEAEAPPLQAAPVVLGMELHCAGCAKKVVKSIKHMPGVKSVVADAASNRVVVEGSADAAALKARIETKTKRPVEILSGGGPKKTTNEPKAGKGGGAGEKKKSDKDGGGETKGDMDFRSLPKEEKEKKQPPEEKKPREVGTQEETVLLKIRLHCADCADRIKRRILKIKGVKDVIVGDIAKDEVRATGTMDVAAMLVYLREKLNRTVEAVALGKKDDGDDKKDKGGGDGEKKKDKAASAGSDFKQDKGKGIEVVGPSRAAAAASMAAPAEANTYHVSPYGYAAYPQPQPQAPPPSYYNYYGGNADGAGYSNSGAPAYYHQQAPDAGAYYHQPAPEAVPYYHQSAPEAVPYYQHPGANADHNPQPQPYPYPYRFDTAPAPEMQMFSDENPNAACSIM